MFKAEMSSHFTGRLLNGKTTGLSPREGPTACTSRAFVQTSVSQASLSLWRWFSGVGKSTPLPSGTLGSNPHTAVAKIFYLSVPHFPSL